MGLPPARSLRGLGLDSESPRLAGRPHCGSLRVWGPGPESGRWEVGARSSVHRHLAALPLAGRAALHVPHGRWPVAPCISLGIFAERMQTVLRAELEALCLISFIERNLHRTRCAVLRHFSCTVDEFAPHVQSCLHVQHATTQSFQHPQDALACSSSSCCRS